MLPLSLADRLCLTGTLFRFLKFAEEVVANGLLRYRIRSAIRTALLKLSVLGVGIILVTLASNSQAYESDVHFGLTEWLALKAGFEGRAAHAIALGNQRADGGLMDSLTMAPEFACNGRYESRAKDQQQRHFPASKLVPSPPREREVVPDSEASRRALVALQKILPGKEQQLLGMLGEALHSLQDSWAHRGVPNSPASWGPMSCDPNLLSMTAAGTDGQASHESDLTRHVPADLLAAAKATYSAMIAYPTLAGQVREPVPFDTLVPSLKKFAAATTKTAKRAWFLEEGISDTSFLEGISLPDGPNPGPMGWQGRKLPALTTDSSNQHDADVSARLFFDHVLAEWAGSAPLDQVAAKLTDAPLAPELALKMKLWSFHDHGSAAPYLHARWPLTGAALRQAKQLIRNDKDLVRHSRISQLVFPLQPLANYPAPIGPYVTRALTTTTDGTLKCIALLRWLHAPYDTVGVVAERRRDVWRLVDIVGMPDR